MGKKFSTIRGFVPLLSVVAGFALAGCSRLNFAEMPSVDRLKLSGPSIVGASEVLPLPAPDNIGETPIVEPTPVIDPAPVTEPAPTPTPVTDAVTPSPQPAPIRTSGACDVGQAVSSCLVCDDHAVEPAPWQPSTKAEKLAEIHHLSCGIANKSDSPTRKAISRLEALSMVQACSPSAYPETPMYDTQALTIAALLGSDPFMRNRIYGGLWYKPPYTDHFEQYFGVYHADIRRVFCEGEDPGSVLGGNLLTAEYYDRCYNMNQCDPSQWPRDSRNAWNALQTIRTQLRSCMTASKYLPQLTKLPGQTEPARKSCSWKKFDGFFELGGQTELDTMLNEGYTVSVETGVSCTIVSSSTSISGLVKLTGFKCQ